MTTGREAAKTHFDAIVNCLLAYDTASAAGKSNISRALTGLNAEYARLRGVPNYATKTYAVLTGELKAAKGALERVRDDRANLANHLVTAGEILSTMSAVLGLIA